MRDRSSIWRGPILPQRLHAGDESVDAIALRHTGEGSGFRMGGGKVKKIQASSPPPNNRLPSPQPISVQARCRD